jgi:hypothetical protein
MSGHELATRLLVAFVSVLSGVAVGWGATALTLAGRMDALEASQARLETMLQTIIKAKLLDDPPQR